MNFSFSCTFSADHHSFFPYSLRGALAFTVLVRGVPVHELFLPVFPRPLFKDLVYYDRHGIG